MDILKHTSGRENAAKRKKQKQKQKNTATAPVPATTAAVDDDVPLAPGAALAIINF
ncbi:uncharacterized protein Z518_04474 [Rhinocladiella mackenziei CBS 650.93]|uniref:Rhinocladiella mackenziei CBS 650.93 unplaced genomic scaffold supercont1.3, whole genome shotgun sequence n=1 Tax=Rhinocladiella mackenziei CBS 650.93 TaxID=1442369 RepID=A0A0D2H7W9_9EURO|nr:uncharacterized protein Z518_04474 [Rhinocladiella mackenziei CBS 650.93]KIX06498.1 hypothetical protein Z518_04474 [Rhinocladiella mackenziei CBS 650.93]